MYLSQLTLNIHSRDARRDAASAYELHCTLARAFAHAPKEVERTLFRADWYEDEKTWKVLILSRHEPNFAVLPRDYVRKIEGPKSYAPEFTPGQRLRFRLLANPTKKVKNEHGKPTRLSLFEADEHGAWLLRKLAEVGAEVLDFDAVSHGLQRCRKHPCPDPDEPPRAPQTHFAVLFEGVLRVTDPAKLRAAVETGIGSAKGYGFGLLSLAPA